MSKARGLTPDKLRSILEVTRKLAVPFDLNTLLHEVVDAAKDLLDAEGGTVWRYDAANHQLELRAARGLDAVRIPADRGIVGDCVRTRALINVPDCYLDPRFNRELDLASGYRTRCLLTLPLLGYDDSLVGVLQIVNKREGVFDTDDEAVANALAAQCAVALQRMQMTERLLGAELLRQEISVAREVQTGTLPKSAPDIAGYDIAGKFQPADDTGGDTFDFVPAAGGRLLVLMGDATGHGIGPALSATQVRAMLRVAQRLGAGLDSTFRHINDQLVEDLPDDRFVTAFLGQLDPQTHQLRYHSGGQGPLLHFRAARRECDFYPPTTFPFGTMAHVAPPASQVITLAAGDVFAVISDGVYEYENPDGQQFGEHGVAGVLRDHHHRPMQELLEVLMQALTAFAHGAPQLDDITIVLVRRLADAAGAGVAVVTAPAAANAPDGETIARQSFARSFASLKPIFALIQAACASAGAGAAERFAVEFTIEELFTNMVKYNPGGIGEIELILQCSTDELVCTLIDPDSDRFDVTAAPEVDIHMPVEARRAGGLGLHLVGRLVDSINYDYSGRRSLICFRKALRGI